MNIIIIDHNKTLHQFHTYKRWVEPFVHNFDFLHGTPKERQTIIDNIPKEVFETKKRTVDITNTKAIAKIPGRDLCPSDDYGITIIDCAHKKVVSLNEYTGVGYILFSGVRNLLMPNYIVSDKKEQLENFKKLVDHKYIELDHKKGKEFLEKINNFLTTGYLPPTGIDHFFNLHMDLPLSKKATGWDFKTTSEYQDIRVYKALYQMLEKNNIFLTFQQRQEWNNFVNERMEDDEDLPQNANAFNKMYEAIGITKEKKQIAKSLKALPTQKLSIEAGVNSVGAKKFKIKI